MKILTAILNTRNSLRVAMLVAGLLAMGTLILLSAAPAQTTTLTVVNNSSKEIRHLYLSPAENDLWGSDQLNESVIGPGATRTLNITWEQPTIKIIAEDQDGCFVTTTVQATSSIEWTIGNDAVRNCGN
ncbi:MAG: hypothetical protein ACREBG_06470 [Pyrinomonadaceae bacterium]